MHGKWQVGSGSGSIEWQQGVNVQPHILGVGVVQYRIYITCAYADQPLTQTARETLQQLPNIHIQSTAAGDGPYLSSILSSICCGRDNIACVTAGGLEGCTMVPQEGQDL
jgi:hypothetical protein